MSGTLTVEGKVFGQKRPLFADFEIALPSEWYGDSEQVTLRALITRIVHAEVEAFRERQDQRKLLQTLSRADIERGLMKGKVDMGGRDAGQTVDVVAAVAEALLAFEDGLYYVFLNDEQLLTLDERVAVRPDSKITFLRLVALAGG